MRSEARLTIGQLLWIITTLSSGTEVCRLIGKSWCEQGKIGWTGQNPVMSLSPSAAVFKEQEKISSQYR
jgi:hypothetical protein